jgi:hypothetical protein
MAPVMATREVVEIAIRIITEGKKVLLTGKVREDVLYVRLRRKTTRIIDI